MSSPTNAQQVAPASKYYNKLQFLLSGITASDMNSIFMAFLLVVIFFPKLEEVFVT